MGPIQWLEAHFSIYATGWDDGPQFPSFKLDLFWMLFLQDTPSNHHFPAGPHPSLWAEASLELLTTSSGHQQVSSPRSRALIVPSKPGKIKQPEGWRESLGMWPVPAAEWMERQMEKERHVEPGILIFWKMGSDNSSQFQYKSGFRNGVFLWGFSGMLVLLLCSVMSLLNTTTPTKRYLIASSKKHVLFRSDR